MKYGLLVLLLVLVGCASNGAKLQKLLDKPMVVKFSKQGRSHYLVGTIHIPLDVEKMYPELFPMIDQSSTFVSEINAKEFHELTLQQMEYRRDYYTNGEGHLKKDLSPETYAWVADELAGISEQTFASLKPARALTLLREKFKTTNKNEKTGYKPIEGIPNNEERLTYDRQLENYARGKNKKLIALESAGDDLLDKCTQLENIYILEFMAFELKYSKTDQARNEALKKSERCVLAERNLAWMKKIKPLLEKESMFIAVGMGHLYSKDEDGTGLVRLLINEGYAVSPQ